MDSVFVTVETTPDNVTKYEMVLERPNFIDEIAVCEKKRGGAHLIGANYLRAIAEEIGRRYDKAFNPYRHVVPTDYVGISCPTLKDVAVVVERMFLERYPKIYASYYEQKVRARPYDVRVIYLVNDADHAGAVERCGVKRIQSSEIDSYLGDAKPVKAVAAVSAPEAPVVQPEAAPFEDEVLAPRAPALTLKDLVESGILKTSTDAVDVAATTEAVAEPVAETTKKTRGKKKSKV